MFDDVSKKSSKKFTKLNTKFTTTHTHTHTHGFHTYTGCGLDFFLSLSRGGTGSRDEPVCPTEEGGGEFGGCLSAAAADEEE